MTVQTSPDPQHTWLQIIALLTEAADRGFAQARRDPGVHSLAVGAQIVASGALALVPEDLDDDLDAVHLDPGTDALDIAGLIGAAEQALRRQPIEELPPGASAIVVALGDLIRETLP